MVQIQKISKWNDLIGNTPLLRIDNLLRNSSFNLFAKLEFFNLGGSMKDRPAIHMLNEALKSGQISKKTTIIESSSGNMGIGLAQTCLRYGLKFICVVDPRTNSSNVKIMKAYGAQVKMITRIPKSKMSFLEARLEYVKKYLQKHPNSFWINQYANENNPRAHYATMNEIRKTLNNKIDYVICATSTCGTIRGCSDYVRNHRLNTKIVAVDAFGSVIFGGESKKRLIPGYGASIRSKLYKDGMANITIHITDEECILGCKELLQKEAIFVGGSSGAIIMAVKKLKTRIPKGSNVVMILADRGERYLDTIYNDEWVLANFKSLSKRR